MTARPVTNEAGLKAEMPAGRTSRDNGAGDREAGTLPPTTRFRTVDEDLLQTQDATGIPRLAFAAQVAGLIGALMLIAFAIWYFSRPATANELYAEIDKEAKEGRDDALRTVERQIDEFLRRFPRDSRAEEISGYKDEIDLARREANIVRRRQGSESLAPIEQLYLEAVRKAETNPPQAVRDLTSILVLYGRDGAAATDYQLVDQTDEARELNRRAEECIALIQRRLERLTEFMEVEERSQLPHMRRRLDQAHAIRPTDPDRALRLYSAIVNLCEGKQWARGIVEEANAAIEAMNEPITTETGPAPRARAPDVEGKLVGSES
jgi:hypothetical protein